VSRTLVRDYDAAGVNSVEPYVSGGAWRYSGVSVTGGGSVDVAGIVRLAASGTWSTELKANPTGETQGGARSFSVPLYLRLGASAVLTPGLNISASAIRADWSSLGDEIAEATGTALGYGAGLELSQFRLFGRDAPLRLGYRQSKMPFSLGSDEVSERLLSGGLALVFSQADGVVFATTDVGVERGRRTGAGVTEEFWRGTVSLRLAAF